MPQGDTGGSSNQEGQNRPNMSTQEMKTGAMGLVKQLEVFLDEYMVTKAPFAIPQGGKDFIVTASPYLVIIMVVLAVPALLAVVGVSTMMAPIAMMGGVGYGLGTLLALAFSAVAVVIEAMAVPGLFKRTKSAWRLVFYATIIGAIGNLISFNIVGGIITAAIVWYVLFQVKSQYTN